jgi:hypothetical protein
VLNSYWINQVSPSSHYRARTGANALMQDGVYKYFEVILVDPSHKAIRRDARINWICDPVHKRREARGLTGAGKKVSSSTQTLCQTVSDPVGVVLRRTVVLEKATSSTTRPEGRRGASTTPFLSVVTDREEGVWPAFVALLVLHGSDGIDYIILSLCLSLPPARSRLVCSIHFPRFLLPSEHSLFIISLPFPPRCPPSASLFPAPPLPSRRPSSLAS